MKKKRGLHHRLKEHHWDETMVIIVLVAAALGILILLADYLNVLGKAYSSLPTEEGVVNMLSNCQMVSGEAGNNEGEWGRGTKCNLVCAKLEETPTFAWKGEEFSLVGLDERIGGGNIKEKYNCLCCSPERLIGESPK